MVIRGEASAKTLQHLYEVCNRLFNDGECFYTNEELEQERTKEKNIFITRSIENGKFRTL